ncbi:PH domain-containing protein [Streptomyces odontomachi]|uniref:PH domain-containing protein n=1 Tax=Streptomyces odontomachi TaxID=2944940 RepID=UPI00210AC945|nr:PH domain-containing protein [Streptomyces sp. ODS25]
MTDRTTPDAAPPERVLPGPGAPELPALPVTFRPALTRAVLLIGGGALFVVLTVIALLLPSVGPGERLSFVLTGGMLFAALVLLSRPKVVADVTGVTVVNIVSSRRLDWAEILHVTLRSGDPWVFLNLSDGTSLPALGIQPGLAKRRALTDARALRALVDAHGAADQGPGH